jgi:hypothetical protein
MRYLPEFVSANSPQLGPINLCGVNTNGATVLVKDVFADTNGTSLPDHAIAPINLPAAAWTTTGGGAATWTIQGNALQISGTMAGGLAYLDSGKANVTVTAVINFLSSSPNANLGVVFRYTGTADLWFCELNESTSSFEMYEVVSASYAMRASAAFTPATNTPYTLVVKASGSTISATVNGGTPLSYGSAATGLSATKQGYWASSSNSGPNTYQSTSFQVTTP